MQVSCLFLFWVHLFFLLNVAFPSLSHPLLTPNNITLYGDAFFRNNGISLTQETTCLPSSSPANIGRALYAYPIRFLDFKNKTTASFSCRFSFSIIPNPLCPFGDGIVFLITSNADSFSFSNGYIGLPQRDLNSQDSFFAVEFDTSFNPSVGDINGNHIGVDVNTVVSFASVDVVSKGVDLKSGKKITAWIEYRDSAKLIQIWVSYSSTKPPSPVLVAQIDLSTQFKEYMHVGFSASNGQGSAMHTVDRWRFKTFRTYRPSVNPIDAIEEGYCFMCSPEDSSTNSPRIYRPHKRSFKMGNMAVALGCLTISVVFVIAIIAVICFFAVRKKRDVGRRGKRIQTRVQMNNVPTRLSLAEIKSATMGFHRNRIVGEGASAVVYKGSLPSAGAVAVKRFDQSNKECGRNPFTTEFATMMGCLKHKNLVQIQGWCCEGSELILVYEYLPNGSLDKLLHKNSDSATFLSWSLRLNIVLGVASALTYLHEECARQIIHRDVKTCNIMLDDEFNAKLGDFGLAEVYEHSCASREATIPAGTIGYLAPEYVYCGVPTVKTDVYSFGVVVLEVATGKRPVAEDGAVLVDWVWDLWVRRKLIEAADCSLSGRYHVLEMERMLKVGLCCVHPNHEKRPTVKEAARILRGEASLPLLPSMRPTVTIRSNLFADSEDILNIGGDHSPSGDDAGWLTPKSHFSKA
ncbi:PREDICTED: L-type lectin-domain containing receptor kinase S.6 [Theobroma cacao]|uniref:non-specific serine/threonine protein kinase n=1 Tax=Theobroma cacao TaxID=3641 RepID=A0AB32UW98_THECC|nr:PREDICTED: L-type lectin-domain containing receptor kinase S.6 [Theobroma cacao]